jgi:hypothetical protein
MSRLKTTQFLAGAAMAAMALTEPDSVLAQSAPRQDRAPAATPAAAGARPAAAATVRPPEPCLRALNGACVNTAVVEETRLRAFVIPQVRVSYFGTPAGTVGGAFIPFERLFQDNPTLFGLPTNTFVQACCVTRSK